MKKGSCAAADLSRQFGHLFVTRGNRLRPERLGLKKNTSYTADRKFRSVRLRQREIY